MKKHISVFLVFYFSSLHCAFAQSAPAIQWQNTIGGSDRDELYCVQQTVDGGYILGGHSTSNISGDKAESSNGSWDCWIVKTDSNGNIQWQNTIGGNNSDWLHSIKQTTDGGYILGGQSESSISGDKTENSNGGWDYWIVKIDSIGIIEWQNTIGGNEDDKMFSIQQTTDGGYILGGISDSDSTDDKTEDSKGYMDYWIVKTDSLGNIQWQNTIGGNDNDILGSVIQTVDGGYLLVGYSRSGPSGDKTTLSNGVEDYWIVKTDSQGSIQWQRSFGYGAQDLLYAVQQTAEGGYILGGSNNSAGHYWIIKTDTGGNTQWQKTFGGSGAEILYSIQQTTDRGYILGGISTSNISGHKTENNWDTICNPNCTPDFWIVKTDSVGNLQWENTIGGSSWDYIFSIQQTNDGGYILGGHSSSNLSGDKTENTIGVLGFDDYWIVKLYPDAITSTFNIQNSEFNISISPNPTSNFIFLNKENLTAEIFDLTGRKLLHQKIKGKQLNISNFSSGIYFLKVITMNIGNNDAVQTFKIIKQ